MSAEYALGMASLAITEIEGLWTVARNRYLGTPIDLIPCVNEAVLDAVEQAPRGFAPRFTEHRFHEDTSPK